MLRAFRFARLCISARLFRASVNVCSEVAMAESMTSGVDKLQYQRKELYKAGRYHHGYIISVKSRRRESHC